MTAIEILGLLTIMNKTIRRVFLPVKDNITARL